MFRIHCVLTALLYNHLIAWPISANETVPAYEEPSAGVVAVSHTLQGLGQGKGSRVRIISARARFRRGWTVQVGAGGGYQIRSLDDGESIDGAVLAGPNIGLGFFVQDWVAVMLRSMTTLAFPEDVSFGRVVPSGFAGLASQFWPLDWLKAEVGVGFAYHRDEADMAERADLGMGFLASLGVQLWQRRSNSLQLGFTYAPLWLDRSLMHPICLELIWQYF